MSETQGGVAGNGPPPIQDFGDAIGWNTKSPRKFSGAHFQRAELFGQMFSGMNCSPCHGILLIGRNMGTRNMGTGSREEIVFRANNAIAKLACMGRLRM